MVWQAAEREPDPLLTLVHAALRDCVFPDEEGTGGFASVPGERWRQAILPDGRVVRADLEASPAWQRRHGSRACAEIRVTGGFTVATAGYRIEAELRIDLATRAILSCEARPTPVSA